MQRTCLEGDPMKKQFLHELVGGLPSVGRQRRLLHVPRLQLNGGDGGRRKVQVPRRAGRVRREDRGLRVLPRRPVSRREEGGGCVWLAGVGWDIDIWLRAAASRPVELPTTQTTKQTSSARSRWVERGRRVQQRIRAPRRCPRQVDERLQGEDAGLLQRLR